jgi:hypothetical protein
MNWLRNFKPRVDVFNTDEASYAQIVCAHRVFILRYKINVRNIDPEGARKWLGGFHEQGNVSVS